MSSRISGHQDDEDEDLVVVLAIPMADGTQTPIRRRFDKAGIMSPAQSTNAAALKRVWNGIFKNKNKRASCNDDSDDNDGSLVFVFQTPNRPTTKFISCPPPAPERETKKAEMCNTESVLEIVRPTPPEEEICSVDPKQKRLQPRHSPHASSFKEIDESTKGPPSRGKEGKVGRRCRCGRDENGGKGCSEKASDRLLGGWGEEE